MGYYLCVMVYTLEQDGQPSKYLGIIRSRDLTEDRLSLREWKEREKRIRKEGKAIDQTSILAQQRDLNKFADEKVKEMNRKKRGKGKKTTNQNRKDEHQRVVSQTPERYELGKALSASVEVNEAETADRSMLSNVDNTDCSIDNNNTSVPVKLEVNKGRAEDVVSILGKLNDRATPQRTIAPALLVVSNSDSTNDDDW